MAIELPKETKDRLIASIKRYLTDELELRSNSQAAQPQAEQPEIGDLKASLLLDFILKEIGPSIYNQAVADAQTRMREMVDEIDGTCYEREFGYWEKGRAG